MNHEEELRVLYYNSTTELTPVLKDNQLEIRVIGFEALKEIVDKKMEEAYHLGIADGCRRCT